MSILAVIFGILSGCFLAVLVGIIGSHRRIGFGWAFLISLIFTPEGSDGVVSEPSSPFWGCCSSPRSCCWR